MPTKPIIISTMMEFNLIPVVSHSPGYDVDKNMTVLEAFHSSADIIVMTSAKFCAFFGLTVEDGAAVIRKKVSQDELTSRIEAFKAFCEDLLCDEAHIYSILHFMAYQQVTHFMFILWRKIDYSIHVI